MAARLPRLHPLALFWLPILAIAGSVSTAGASPGDLDPSFGTGGKSLVAIGPNSMAFDVARQPDGKLVVVGATFNTTIFDGAEFVVARFEIDGAIDAGFGTGGVTTTLVGIPTDCCDILETQANAVAIQADGKIVVAGKAMVAFGPDVDAALVRYEADGTLDVTFGTGGILIEPAIDSFEDVAIQADGRIVAAGSTAQHVTSPNGGVIARYDSDGSPDATFGGAGLVATPSLRAIEILDDGRLLAAGGIGALGSGDFWLGRFLPTGAPDPTFGTAGATVTDFGTAEIAQALSIAPSGAIVVGGDAWSTDVLDYSEILVARYHADGSLDLTFDSDGKVEMFVGTPILIPTPPFVLGVAAANAIAVRPDGSIVVGGTLAYDFYGFAIPFTFALARLSADGSLDAGFVAEASGSLSAVSALLLEPTAIVVAGWSGPISTPIQLGVARHLIETVGPLCGDGTVDLGEECDDGNLTSGDCCSASCGFETVGSSCGSAAPCVSASTCDGAGTCVEGTPTPMLGCKVALTDAAGRLVLKHGSSGVPRLTWKWKRGEETLLAEFAEPVVDDDYTLCLFSEGVAIAYAIPAGGSCAGKPCWRDLRRGVRYRNRDATPDGIRSVRTRAGADGKTKIAITGKGVHLSLPASPVALPLVAQLHAENGACWESTFEASGVRRNDSTTFVGVSSLP